jgi:hypothetical protein
MPQSNEEILKDIRVAYRHCFETEHGKKVLKDLELRCFGKHKTFTQDPYVTAFNEGTRSAFLYIQNMMEVGEDNADS